MIRASVLGLAGLMAFGPAYGDSGRSPVVLELFTSQGCSSCPPADRLLSGLAQRSDVLPLSFHVDYWDNLGWKDPFSSAANTERQKAYRGTFGNAEIYTPQMVIGGRSEMVGSDARAVASAMARIGNRPSTGPDLAIRRDGQVVVTVAAADPSRASTVWLAAYALRHETVVRRGENAGKTLVETNVVRKLVALGRYTGTSLILAAPAGFAQEDEGVAAWLQTNPVGEILSAANAPPRSR